MDIALLQVPWDSGLYNKRMGKGPVHLVQQGLVEHLQAGGNNTELVKLKLSDEFITEITAARQLNAQLSEAVQKACNKNRFPVILAGNCNAALGVVSGLALPQPGVVWFDAHADFNTPDTTVSGFFDGMALSILTGNSWKKWRGTISGFSPIHEQNIVLIGVRDVDSEEQKLLASSEITPISVSDIRRNTRKALSPPLNSLSRACKKLYLHIDLDVFDPAQLKANNFSAGKGLLLPEIKAVLEYICKNFEVAAMSFTSYDPNYDPDNQGHIIVKSILDTVLPMVELKK